MITTPVSRLNRRSALGHLQPHGPVPYSAAMTEPEETAQSPLRARIHQIIFEAETPAGRAFDISLFLLILASVTCVMLDSVAAIQARYHLWLYRAEMAFTFLFTLEYLLRIYSVRRPLAYMRSFYGVVDLLAILPGYLSLLLPGTEFLLTIRMLRLLRIFRVLKLVAYFRESQLILAALRASSRKIAVFLFTVLLITVVAGSLMYVIEGPANGFTSIPISVYWCIVTITTVGYGDIAPKTPPGQILASCIMILGYAIIAVPTGIVTSQMMQTSREHISTQHCRHCGAEGHDTDARFCKLCGGALYV